MCAKTYTQAQAIQYARLVYRRDNVTRKAQRRVGHLRACLRNPKAKLNVKRHVRRFRKQRKRRFALLPYSCSGQRWAIPCSVISCESKFDWHAYNPSGALGPYQLLGHGAPWPVRTQADKMAHHRIAANLYRSQGLSPWVCA